MRATERNTQQDFFFTHASPTAREPSKRRPSKHNDQRTKEIEHEHNLRAQAAAAATTQKTKTTRNKHATKQTLPD